MTQSTVHATIAEVLASQPSYVPTLTPTRYPFTYAYDFFRSHAERFGAGSDLMSRGEAAKAIREYAERTGQARQDVIVALADAYLAKEGIEVAQAEKNALMDHARATAWASLDLPRPVGS